MKDEKQMKTAVKKYNEIMETLGNVYLTIGTSFSVNTENWNLRDMVAECDYVLSTYYEEGHVNYEMRFSDDMDDRKMWRSHVGMLSRFIKHWWKYACYMKCTEGHCSKYD